MGHQSISMIWTARAVGTFFACTMSGQVFGSSWMSTTRRKLLYFASAHLIISISMYNIPFLFNLIQTLVCFGFMTFATGSYDVADNGFVHQKFGTKMSRPVIQSLHAFASVGFLSCKSASFIANLFLREWLEILSLSASFLMSYLLPQSQEKARELCKHLKNPDKNITTSEDDANITSSSESKFCLHNFWKVFDFESDNFF